MATDKKKIKVIVIHGPNLNMLGKREPDIYGHETLDTIDRELKRIGKTMGIIVDTFQSNHEGEIVDRLQQATDHASGIIINPAAYTHTSVAIRDALLALNLPTIEIHLSNIYKREPFRHRSMIADVVTGQISGLGVRGYRMALETLADMIR